MEVLGRTIQCWMEVRMDPLSAPLPKVMTFSGIYFLFRVGLGVLFASVEQH